MINTDIKQEGILTGSVHWQIEVLNLAKAPEYLAQVILRDILGQPLHHNLCHGLSARGSGKKLSKTHFRTARGASRARCSTVTWTSVAPTTSASTAAAT